ERLQTLSAREEILRTRLQALQGMALPIQVIADKGDIPLEVVEWRDLASEALAQALHELRNERALAHPLQVWLAQTADDRWHLLLKGDALLLDLPSLWLLARELTGAPSPAEPLQYVDYAEWKH